MTSRQIGDFSESHLLSVAKGVVQKKTEGTALLDTTKEARIPKFKLKGTTTVHSFFNFNYGFYLILPRLLLYILISIVLLVQIIYTATIKKKPTTNPYQNHLHFLNI